MCTYSIRFYEELKKIITKKLLCYKTSVLCRLLFLISRPLFFVYIYFFFFQIDFGSVQPGVDRAPYEELISKQPLSIAYLRQYLRPSALWVDKQIKT